MSGHLLRLCGCSTDEPDHIDPEPDWIGNAPIMHGESERPVLSSGHDLYGYWTYSWNYCLCGHPSHLSCPEAAGEGSILGYRVEAEQDPREAS